MFKGLTLFKRKHSNGYPCKSFTLMSWHPTWSLTWSWVVSWNPDYIKQGYPFYYLRYSGYKSQGWYFMCGIKLPLIGHISFQNQPTMKRKGE
jgi:hypothetical protein